MKNISSDFPISNEEYRELEKEFGQLAKFASWELIRKNVKNNHTDDFEDINQELIMALVRAGSYYKRQIYIEKCLKTARKYVKDRLMRKLLRVLAKLWLNRTRHGANRQKFGFIQEQILDNIIRNCVPKSQRPNKNSPLVIDEKFTIYCKAINWNTQKSLGRKITKEKSIRVGVVSLSDYDYLGSEF